MLVNAIDEKLEAENLFWTTTQEKRPKIKGKWLKIHSSIFFVFVELVVYENLSPSKRFAQKRLFLGISFWSFLFDYLYPHEQLKVDFLPNSTKKRIVIQLLVKKGPL